MATVTSDKDLPKPLDTTSKQVKALKKLVAEHLGKPVKHVDRPPLQGMFSRTLFVTLADGTQGVVQFRITKLDLDTFNKARTVLGSYVPEVTLLASQELEDAGAWVYYLQRIPGTIWLRGIAGKGDPGRIAINKSLGRVFSKGFIDESSHDAVERIVQPHINAILKSKREEISPFKDKLRDLSSRLERLASLPLWISHCDLNEVNVLIDENCDVTGLVDWEYSYPLPFGLGFGRIHTLAGEYHEGEFEMSDGFEEAERGFWDSMFEGMPDSVRQNLLGQYLDAVQDAVLLGTFMDCFFLDEVAHEVGVASVSLKALPKFLTYRLPHIRGDESPYQI